MFRRKGICVAENMPEIKDLCLNRPLSKVRYLRPEINFRAESRSLLKQASASSRAIYRSALKNQDKFQF